MKDKLMCIVQFLLSVLSCGYGYSFIPTQDWGLVMWFCFFGFVFAVEARVSANRAMIREPIQWIS